MKKVGWFAFLFTFYGLSLEEREDMVIGVFCVDAIHRGGPMHVPGGLTDESIFLRQRRKSEKWSAFGRVRMTGAQHPTTFTRSTAGSAQGSSSACSSPASATPPGTPLASQLLASLGDALWICDGEGPGTLYPACPRSIPNATCESQFLFCSREIRKF